MRTSKVLPGVVVAVCVAVGMPAVLASRALAASPVYECIPLKYGAAVTAGNASGECKVSKKTTYTSVALPATAEEQQKLLAILPYMRYVASGVGGKPTIQVSGANLQILSGGGRTYEANGAGNLVIGYDEKPGMQTGSNNLVLGGEQSFPSYGAIVGGYANRASGPYSDVFGILDKAEGYYSSVGAGIGNTAEGMDSSVSGGGVNRATGFAAAVSGGELNKAEGEVSSVTGGQSNTVEGPWSSIVGGYENKTLAERFASISGGFRNTASANFATILGGKEVTLTTEYGQAF